MDKPYHARSMTWAQRLKRVFNIDITECEKCQSHNVTTIACITEPAIIHNILSHLDKHGSSITANSARAPHLKLQNKQLSLMILPPKETLTLAHDKAETP